MEMPQSYWLSYCTLSNIRVQWFKVVFKMATSFRFSKDSLEDLELLMENSVPEKTRQATKYGMKILTVRS